MSSYSPSARRDESGNVSSSRARRSACSRSSCGVAAMAVPDINRTVRQLTIIPAKRHTLRLGTIVGPAAPGRRLSGRIAMRIEPKKFLMQKGPCGINDPVAHCPVHARVGQDLPFFLGRPASHEYRADEIHAEL